MNSSVRNKYVVEAVGTTIKGVSTTGSKYYITTLGDKKVRIRTNPSGGKFAGSLKELERRLHTLSSYSVEHVVRTRRILESVLQSQGEKVAKEVRFLAALKRGGFREVELSNVSFENVASAAGVRITMEGRKVVVVDGKGKQSFTDDCYWTGMRWLFRELELKTGVGLPLLDQRALNTVRKLCGNLDPHDWLVSLLEDGKYHKERITAFLGGSGLSGLRKLEFKMMELTGVEVDMVRKKIMSDPVKLLALDAQDFVKAFKEIDMRTAKRKMSGWANKVDRTKIGRAVKGWKGGAKNFDSETLVMLESLGFDRRQICAYLSCNMDSLLGRIPGAYEKDGRLFDGT